MSTATANDIINRAGRRLKILAGEEAFSAAEMTDNLRMFNDMLVNFPARGIQYSHTDLGQTDTVNVPDQYQRALILVFSKELAMDYGVQIDPVSMDAINDSENQLRAYYLSVQPAVADRGLIRRTNNVGYFNITRGF